MDLLQCRIIYTHGRLPCMHMNGIPLTRACHFRTLWKESNSSCIFLSVNTKSPTIPHSKYSQKHYMNNDKVAKHADGRPWSLSSLQFKQELTPSIHAWVNSANAKDIEFPSLINICMTNCTTTPILDKARLELAVSLKPVLFVVIAKLLELSYRSIYIYSYGLNTNL